MMVDLSEDQIARAMACANIRNQVYKRNGSRKYGQTPDRGDADNFLGALGEIAAHMVIPSEWHGGRNEGGPDLILPGGTHVEVRASERMNSSLILHPTDTAQIGVLVLGSPPRMCVRGWCIVKRMRVPAYWRMPEPTNSVRHEAWFVPQSKLMPIAELNARIEAAQQKEQTA